MGYGELLQANEDLTHSASVVS